MKTKDRIWNLNTVSTFCLIILMLVYLAMTLWSSNELAMHMEVVSEHPFEVVASVGDLKTYVAGMRIRAERLMMHQEEEDIKLVEESLESTYQAMEVPLDKISTLYLGDQQNVKDLKDTFARLKEEQGAFLAFAIKEDSSLEEIEQYESEHLSPLYGQAAELLDIMLKSAQSMKVKYGKMAESLRWKTLWGSLALMSLMIGGLLSTQYILRRQKKDLVLRSQLFDNLSTSIDDAFIIFHVHTKEIFYTALNIERILGRPVERLEDIYIGMRDEDADEVRSFVSIGDFTLPLSKTVEYTLPDREKRWISVRLYPGNHMSSSQVICVLSDCTEEMKSRQALQDALLNAEKANMAKSDFLSRMSHEIRTPLNAVIGMTTIAAASVNSPEKVENCLTKINFSSKHLLMLVNDVLDMSKIESSKMDLQKEPYDLSQVVNSFVSTTYAQAKAKGVDFKAVMEGFEGQTQYIGDPLRLNQILLNLGSNAVKFTPPGGTVTLTVSRLAVKRSTDTVRFIVKDTGIGMTQEAVERIFKPFEQADATISSRFGGTGLGMSITKNLVTLMSGNIQIKSKPDEGTSFTVDVPLMRDMSVMTQPDFGNLGLRALVVDDEQAVCLETASLLENIKIDAEWVCNGLEAVERVTEAWQTGNHFDFCLVDWMIPDIDGIEVTRRIRANVGTELPIIMISSYDCSEFEEEARAAGANAFLPKPLYRTSMYTAIQSALNCDKQDQPVGDKVQKCLKGKRMLVAEDNDLNREIIMELLNMNGIEVECAVDGSEALKAFNHSSPGYYDVILMDVQMPVMNGYEAAKQIRLSSHPDAGKIPIIATTANAFSDDISTALASGMNTHISKPIDMEQLCKVLSEFLT